MIMPTKHINFSESLLGFGSYILAKLEKPQTVDELWKIYRKDIQKEFYFTDHSFDNFISTLLFLYSMDSVIEERGVLKRCA
jgi:hypothetical protein